MDASYGRTCALMVSVTLQLILSATAFVLACGAFANSLDGGFVIDDGSAVRTNLDLRPEVPLRQLLAHDYWGRPIEAAHSVKSYRPLAVLSFRCNFALHGLAVRGYHVANVVLHAICSALVVPLTLSLSESDNTAIAAAVASLSFAVHPVHCEAVASIVGRAEVLCCAFYLLCLLLYARSASARRPLAAWALLAAAAASAVLATASKETGITALGTAVALERLAMRWDDSPPRRSVHGWLGRLLCCLGVTGGLWVGSRHVRGAAAAILGSGLSPY